MEIFVNGPGVSIVAQEIDQATYAYWKTRGPKDLFDYSWNIPDLREDTVFDEDHPSRTSMAVPRDADFLGDKSWQEPTFGKWVIAAADYETETIYVEDNGVIEKYQPHDIPHVKHVLKPFMLEDENDRTVDYFYTGFSTEIGNWQHKQYSTPIPLGKFRLQIMEVSRRRWIIGLETSQEVDYDMYEETHLDWSYRLHVRNRIFLEDWMKATGLELEYDMFTGNHERDCSNFLIHEPDSREYPKDPA